MVMRLEYVGIAFSGRSIMLMGKAYGRDVGYQAAIDLLEQLSISPGVVVFVERFGKVAERHTCFRTLPEATYTEPNTTVNDGV